MGDKFSSFVQLRSRRRCNNGLVQLSSVRTATQPAVCLTSATPRLQSMPGSNLHAIFRAYPVTWSGRGRRNSAFHALQSSEHSLHCQNRKPSAA